MGVTLEELQPFIDKEAVFHIVQEDGSLEEVRGTIRAATVAGVPYKQKGKSDLKLTTYDKIEEISLAPEKAKSVTRKRLDPIELGKARQHLVDRHGVSVAWAKDASEQDAFNYHSDLSHDDLGHYHAAKVKDEREVALEV